MRGKSYPLEQYLDPDKLSPSYNHFCSLISITFEPKVYHEIVQDPKRQDAMVVEIAVLESNHAWTLTPMPPNKKAIGSK